MDSNTLILIIITVFSTALLCLFTYHEYFKKTKCDLLTLENCRRLQAGQDIQIPILQRETHLEDQFDNEPYNLYRDYFDQNSPWIGTEWAHKAEIKEESKL